MVSRRFSYFEEVIELSSESDGELADEAEEEEDDDDDEEEESLSRKDKDKKSLASLPNDEDDDDDDDEDDDEQVVALVLQVEDGEEYILDDEEYIEEILLGDDEDEDEDDQWQSPLQGDLDEDDEDEEASDFDDNSTTYDPDRPMTEQELEQRRTRSISTEQQMRAMSEHSIDMDDAFELNLPNANAAKSRHMSAVTLDWDVYREELAEFQDSTQSWGNWAGSAHSDEDDDVWGEHGHGNGHGNGNGEAGGAVSGGPIIAMELLTSTKGEGIKDASSDELQRGSGGALGRRPSLTGVGSKGKLFPTRGVGRNNSGGLRGNITRSNSNSNSNISSSTNNHSQSLLQSHMLTEPLDTLAEDVKEEGSQHSATKRTLGESTTTQEGDDDSSAAEFYEASTRHERKMEEKNELLPEMETKDDPVVASGMGTTEVKAGTFEQTETKDDTLEEYDGTEAKEVKAGTLKATTFSSRRPVMILDDSTSAKVPSSPQSDATETSTGSSTAGSPSLGEGKEDKETPLMVKESPPNQPEVASFSSPSSTPAPAPLETITNSHTRSPGRTLPATHPPLPKSPRSTVSASSPTTTTTTSPQTSPRRRSLEQLRQDRRRLRGKNSSSHDSSASSNTTTTTTTNDGSPTTMTTTTTTYSRWSLTRRGSARRTEDNNNNNDNDGNGNHSNPQYNHRKSSSGDNDGNENHSNPQEYNHRKSWSGGGGSAHRGSKVSRFEQLLERSYSINIFDKTN